MAEQDTVAVPDAASAAAPQSFDDAFKPQAQTFDEAFKAQPETPALFPHPPMSLNPQEWRSYLDNAPAGRIISAFGSAFTGPGLTDELVDELRPLGFAKDISDHKQDHADTFAQAIVRPIITQTRAFNEFLLRGVAAPFDVTGRVIGGTLSAISQAGQEAGAPQFARDVAAIGEMATTFGQVIPGAPVPAEPKLPPDVAAARNAAVIGEGEQGFMGTAEPSNADIAARAAAGADIPTAAPEPAAPPATAVAEASTEGATPAPTPTIHDIARQAQPDLFREYDALQVRRDTFARWMRDLPEQTRANIEAKPPEALRTLDDQIAATERKLENAGARRRGDFQEQLDTLHDQRADLIEDLMRNHPDVAQVRKALQETDNRMRDLAPDVSAAYRDAELRAPQTEEIGAGEPAVKPQNELVPTAASEPPTEAAPVPAEAAPSAAEAPAPGVTSTPAEPPREAPAATPATPEQLRQIADDVTATLTAAGRPDEEARAAAQIVAAYYDTRAQRFGGKLGTAQEIYDREAPDIQIAERRASTREPAMAQGGRRPVGQMSILKDGRRVIRLFKDGDASTFMHETGHVWLEDMLADAEHPLAPDDLKADAASVKKWLGVEEGARPTGRQHEKFARGWERYLMEGVAPSRQLASVFAKFKDWLTRIYQTVARLKSPINDDIRDVFDRLLSRAPEKVTIAPEVERPGTMADIHEAEAEHTPAAEAEPVLDKQRTEFATDARAKTPEIVPELQLEPATEGGPGPAERPSPNGGEPAPGPESGAAGGVQGPGTQRPSPGEVGAEGAAVPSEPAAGEPAGGPGPGGATGERAADTGTANPELIDKAGNIRLDNLNQPEDVDDALRQIAREQNDFEADRFGPEGKQLHDQILAARKLTAQAMQEMTDARVKAAAENASEADLLAYRDSADRLTLIARRLATLTHSWGYAGQAFRELNGLPDSTKTITMAQLAERTKGLTFNQLRQEAQLGMKFDTPAQQMKFINDLRQSDWEKARSMIIELFVNNLISGLITHMTYTVGNESANLFRAGVEGPIAAAISAIRGRAPGERIYFGEAQAVLYSHTKGAADGWAAAQKAWKTGIAETLPGELEALSPKEREQFEANRVPNTGAIPGKIGEAIRLPSHGVAAIHSFGRAVGAAQELWRLAYRSASDAGLEGEAFDRHVADFIDNPPEGTLEKVNEAATRGVLMQRAKYGTAFYHLKQLTEKNLAAKLIAPFMQIGANLLHEAFLERTPLGMINKDIRDNLLGRNGAIAQDMQTGKMVAGITAATAVIGLTLNGIVSGGGPSDWKQKELLQATGWQPYSLKVGETWVPYRKYLGPLGLLVAGAADTAEVGHALSEKDLKNAAGALLGGLQEVVADESWFRGVSDFINAARNYDNAIGERYARNLASDFIPYAVGLSQTARLVDPYSRQVRSLTDSARAHVPGLSESLMPRRDVLGDEVPSRLMTSPSAMRNSAVLNAMIEAQVFPTTVSRKIRGVELTDRQYDDYARIAGRALKLDLQGMVSNPRWSEIPINLRHKMITEAVTHARERARSTVIAQSIGTDHDIAKAALSAKVKRLSDTE